MPGPLIKPKSFPGVEKLPPLAKELVERYVYPPDELPMPGAIAGAKLPINVAKQGGLEVLRRIRTLPSFQGFSPDAVSAFTRLQQKYPRLFGHLLEVEAERMPTFPHIQYGKQIPYAGGRSKIAIRAGLAGDQAYDTAAHELTHAAQNLKAPNTFDWMYALLEKLYGYSKHPLEVSARKAGANFVSRVRNPK